MFRRHVNNSLIFRIIKGMRIALSNCLIVESKQANMKRRWVIRHFQDMPQERLKDFLRKQWSLQWHNLIDSCES